jgi:alkylresorcinol/alkylpyrone synthase
MFITGLGMAAPPRKYTQRECWTTLIQSPRFEQFTPRARAILKKVLTGDSGIETRHLALEDLNDAFKMTPDTLHARFRDHAPSLAADAARAALTSAGLQPGEIGALLISTCTGYLCPGLTSYVSEILGLNDDVLLLDLVGQGCGAALPNLRAGEALIAAGLCKHVLSVCVEVCSAAFYLDDDPGVLISACLFGDGAGAAVLSAEPSYGRRRMRWCVADTTLKTADRELLRFEQKNGMLRNILALEVPTIAARHVEQVLDQALTRARAKRSDITGWVLHPGGRDVMDAVGRRLGLAGQELRWSRGVLRELGNVSSASLYFVLARALSEGARGGLWWLSSFGAGFSCHGALLEVE